MFVELFQIRRLIESIFYYKPYLILPNYESSIRKTRYKNCNNNLYIEIHLVIFFIDFSTVTVSLFTESLFNFFLATFFAFHHNFMTTLINIHLYCLWYSDHDLHYVNFELYYTAYLLVVFFCYVTTLPWKTNLVFLVVL